MFDKKVSEVNTIYHQAPELTHLARKLLKRGNFTSLDDLKAKVLAFIGYYNLSMARPFEWTYKGKALSA